MRTDAGTVIPETLIPETDKACRELADEYSRIISDRRFTAYEKPHNERGEIVSHVGSESYWRLLQVGTAVFDLRLYHLGNSRPPHSLEVLHEQLDQWTDSVHIGYPFEFQNQLHVWPYTRRTPSARPFEIQPLPDGGGLRLIEHRDTKAKTLLRAAGVRDVNGLWAALEDAIYGVDPDMESVSSYYIVQSLFSRYLHHTDAYVGCDVYRYRKSNGVWQAFTDLKVTFGRMFTFMAKWSEPSLDLQPLSIRYSSSDELVGVNPAEIVPAGKAEDLRRLAEVSSGETWSARIDREADKYGVQPEAHLVNRREFEAADLQLVSAVGQSVLQLYAARYSEALMP